MSQLNIVTAQSAALEPERFQACLIENLSQALLREPSPPCLLRAPTGSGKTFMLARVLANVSAARPTLWLWFVPFVNLVQQTEDQLAANSPSLTPTLLAQGRNQDPRAGTVLLSTAQAVARARDRTTGYQSDGDDTVRTLAEMLARARAQGLAIGLVVDEAHIGLDTGTEFGQFAQWVNPNFLILATATPKDERLQQFFDRAGRVAYESFSVSRLEAVEARLNKRYIEAVVYDLRQSIASVADLKRTVLRQAWLRHQWLKQKLLQAGIDLTPLLLVQVGNGGKTVEEAEHELIRICKVPPAAIGKHSADAPDPVLMAAIANDPTKEVLIFKQSAGTGFDAPRAFVLASTKTVNDPDFAMQFIGRVMRVAQPIRVGFPRSQPIPADLDTAYVYLADADAQRGFQAAVQNASAVKNQLDGQTERLETRQTLSGATTYTNRDTAQPPLMYAMPEQPDHSAKPLPVLESEREPDAATGVFGPQSGLWASAQGNSSAGGVLDEVQAATATASRVAAPRNESELIAALRERGIATYRKRSDLAGIPRCLQREQRPQLADMARVSHAVAERLPLDETLKLTAVKAATDQLREREVHTELTQGTRREEAVEVITDRQALAREAIAVLRRIPQVEDEDVSIIVRDLAARLGPVFAEQGVTFPDPKDLTRRARDAAFWVIRYRPDAVVELIQSIVSEFTSSEDSESLPDAMVFPTDLPLTPSRKNIYGVMPPSSDELGRIGDALGIDQQASLGEHTIDFDATVWRQATFDGGFAFNGEEREFAKSLDDADFVRWWHRNPDRKPYSVRLVRADHQNYFYPDFVVCIEHATGESPIPRLIETKDDTKDAARKARRIPRIYGKVLFVTRDQGVLRVVNDDGSLGHIIDRDSLEYVQQWMRETRTTP
jgi:type III restriction enzyme